MAASMVAGWWRIEAEIEISTDAIDDYSGYISDIMNEIRLRDAKAGLSAVVDGALRGEPSVITRHGKKQAVAMSYAEWEKLSQVPSFGRLLMSATGGHRGFAATRPDPGAAVRKATELTDEMVRIRNAFTC